MSNKLAISAALSVLLMACYVVLGTESQDPATPGLSGSMLQASLPEMPALPAFPFLPR